MNYNYIVLKLFNYFINFTYYHYLDDHVNDNYYYY